MKEKLHMIYAIMIIMFIVIIVLVIKVEKISKNNIQEDVTNTGDTLTDSQLKAINNQISQIYNMDVEAIRNLGAISKSLLTGTNYHSTIVGTPGSLTIPADTTILQGSLQVNQNATVTGNITTNNITATNINSTNDITIGKNLNVNGQFTSLAGGLQLKNTNYNVTGNDATIGNIVSDNVTHKALMISGNNSAGSVRRVKIYDDLTVSGNLSVNGGNINGVTKINGQPVMNTVIFEGWYDGDWAKMYRELLQYMKDNLPTKYCICYGIFTMTRGAYFVVGVCINGRYTTCNRGYDWDF